MPASAQEPQTCGHMLASRCVIPPKLCVKTRSLCCTYVKMTTLWAGGEWNDGVPAGCAISYVMSLSFSSDRCPCIYSGFLVKLGATLSCLLSQLRLQSFLHGITVRFEIIPHFAMSSHNSNSGNFANRYGYPPFLCAGMV